jgi:hypothetical protein
MQKQITVETMKGVYYCTDILASYKDCPILQLAATTSSDMQFAHGVYEITRPAGKLLLKTLKCPRNAEKAKHARKECETLRKLAEHTKHFAKPLAQEEVVVDAVSDLIQIETLSEHCGLVLSRLVGRAQPADLRTIATQTIKALEVLESARLSDVDIKPETFAIANDIVKMIQISPTTMHEVSKTPKKLSPQHRNLPPEAFRRQESCLLDRVMMYGWGMLMYQLASGKTDEELLTELETYKLEGKDYRQFLEIVDKLKIPNDTDGQCTTFLKPLLLRALAFQPLDRPTFLELKTSFVPRTPQLRTLSLAATTEDGIVDALRRCRDDRPRRRER